MENDETNVNVSSSEALKLPNPLAGRMSTERFQEKLARVTVMEDLCDASPKDVKPAVRWAKSPKA